MSSTLADFRDIPLSRRNARTSDKNSYDPIDFALGLTCAV